MRERVILGYVLKHHCRNGHRWSPYSDSEAYIAQRLLVEGAMCVTPGGKRRRCEVEEYRRSGDGSY